MNSNYTSVVGLAIVMLICSQPAFSQFTISGIVHKETGKPISSVSVSLTSPGYTVVTTMTDAQGRYAFPNIEAGREVTITAARNDNHRNGVSILDMVKIHRHLVQSEPFDSPYKLIAADVNNSQAVSAIDVVELRKLLLGISSVFLYSDSWKFVDAAFDFTAPGEPWSMLSDDPRTIEFTVTGDVSDADFIGIKIGDVTNNAQ